MLAQSLWVQMCIDPADLVALISLVSSIPSVFCNPFASPSVEFPDLWEKTFDGNIHLELNVPRSLILFMMSGWGYLYLFPSGKIESSDDRRARHWSMSIAKCHWESFYCYFLKSSIWYYPRSLGYLVSGFWSPEQYWVWVPSGEVDF